MRVRGCEIVGHSNRKCEVKSKGCSDSGMWSYRDWLKAEIVKNGDGRNRKLGYSGWGGRGDGLRENSIRGQGKRERGRGRRWRVEESFTEEVKLKWSRVRLYVLVCMC